MSATTETESSNAYEEGPGIPEHVADAARVEILGKITEFTNSDRPTPDKPITFVTHGKCTRSASNTYLNVWNTIPCAV
jgi:hypothetical protein